MLLCQSPRVLRIRSEHAQELKDCSLIVMHWPLNLLERRDKRGCFIALDNKHLNPLRVYNVKKLLNMSAETVLWEAEDAALPANLTVITWKFHCKPSVLPPSKRARAAENAQDGRPTTKSHNNHLIKLSSVTIISLLGA